MPHEPSNHVIALTAETAATVAHMPIEELARYKITTFGRALVAYGEQQLGITEEIQKLLQKEMGGTSSNQELEATTLS